MKGLILVVDDDETTRKILCAFLESRGYGTSQAANGSDAFMEAQRLKPAAIVMDVIMPSLYGTAAVKKLMDSGATASIPILIHSGAPMDAVLKLLPDGARVRLAPKPTHLPDLLDALERLIAGK